jgi:predicted small secreted protein
MKRQFKLIMILGLLAAVLLTGCSQKAESGADLVAVRSSNRLYMDIKILMA